MKDFKCIHTLHYRMLKICCFWRSVLWKLLSVMRPQIEKMWSFGATHSAVGIHWAIRISDMRVQYNFFSLHHSLSLLSHSIPLFSSFLFFYRYPRACWTDERCNHESLQLCLWYVWLSPFWRCSGHLTAARTAAAPMPLIIYSSSITVRLISVWVTLHERVWMYLNIINPKCTQNLKIVSFFHTCQG